ncbi:hypothetical protein QE152_g19554 [Popillia japonica]|uniref:Uncharacterized protein n=1 Tax=Popillia japonica TaxID=7064 RepID=A0AAW1KQV1_POPJA
MYTWSGLYYQRIIAPQECKQNLSKEIGSRIDKKARWEGLVKIIDQSWPAKCYKNVEHIAAETLGERKGNLAIITSPTAGFEGE